MISNSSSIDIGEHKRPVPKSASTFPILGSGDEEVDDLMKEIDSAAEQYLNHKNDDYLVTEDGEITFPLLNNSPTKPLHFPKQTFKNTANANNFNSSSDTYTTDQDTGNDDHKEVHANGNINNSFNNIIDNMSHKDLFDRNFSLDYSQDAINDVQTEINGPIISDLTPFESKKNTEVNFIKPVELQPPQDGKTNNDNNKNQQQQILDTNEIDRLSNNASPSKSIMKKANTPHASPKKKAVAFTNHTPDTYHYEIDDLSEDEDIVSEQTSNFNKNYLWQSVPHQANGDSSDEDDNPPSPPPHKSNNLMAFSDSEDDQDLNEEQLKILKQNKKYSNLSFNEKMDMFLLKNKQNDNQDLDEHLNDLENQKQDRTAVNVQNLSLSLKTQDLEKMENPLNSLSKSEDVDLNSGITSRSSIQSLQEKERTLHSENVNTVSKSVELRDGIKGFTDSAVESLITENVKSVPKVVGDYHNSSNEEFHDSFDYSYNNTEQSIMDLLQKTGALPQKQDSIHQLSQTTSHLILDQDRDIHIKEEPAEELFTREIIVKNEEETDQILPDELIIKPEPNEVNLQSNIKSEIEEFGDQIKSESHGSGISLGNNLKEEFEPVNIQYSHIPPTYTNEELEIPASSYSTGNIEESFIEENSARFTLRDHVDKDWKFEDSHDGDREDNTEYSLLEQTTQHEEPIHENEIVENILNTNNEVLTTDKLNKEVLTTEILNKEVLTAEKLNNEVLTEKLKLSGVELEKEIIPAKLLSESKSQDDKEVESLVETTPVEIDHKNEASKNFNLSESSIVSSNTLQNVLEINLSPNVSSESNLEHQGEANISLAPPRLLEPPTPRVSVPNSPIKKKELREINIDESENLQKTENLNEVAATNSDMEQELIKETIETKDSLDSVLEALANSSNVILNDDITLPPLEENNYDSFEDITRNLDASVKSFEETFSAEFDPDPVNKSSNFISIWHSQKKSGRTPSNGTPKVIQLPLYGVIPSTIQAKKFKEVNVITRRIISGDDLNVSGFLPELSQDSGFEDLKTKYEKSTNISSGGEEKTLESDDHISEDEKPFVNNDTHYVGLKPPKVSSYRPNVHKSQFRVSSFEIVPTNTKWKHSPRDQYNNDIFSDTVKRVPTIKGQGMKTLPSMDRNDVQRILNTKRILSQEEYANVKLLGSTNKEFVSSPLDYKPHVATLHDARDIDDCSFASSAKRDITSEKYLPHLVDELQRNPSALLSQDQVFRDDEFSSPVRGSETYSSDGSITSMIKTKKQPTLEPKSSQAFPEPDPEFINPPRDEIFKTPPKESSEWSTQKQNYNFIESNDDNVRDRLLHYDSTTHKTAKRVPPPLDLSPGKKSPIKIGSPLKIIRNQDGIRVENIASPTTGKTQDDSSFLGSDALSSPLRYNKTRDNRKPVEANSQAYVTPPVERHSPTFERHVDSSAPEKSGEVQEYEPLDDNINLNHKKLRERGKLFMRIVGLKNIDLPSIHHKNAEFSITLDNGVHCIKTPNYALNNNHIQIGKEFELTVGESLEFILTLKATYKKPKDRLVEVRERRVLKLKNKVSRLFKGKEIVTESRFVPVEVKDNWSNKLAQDGSFARCYVDFEQYEGKITGKVCNFDITCFNEWETLVDKEGKITKCKPYRIGQLEVKMLFIPRSSEREILPSSIKSAYESINTLKGEINFYKEGYMYQEGGDCEVWKRRFFKLQGTSLIAHSEYSHKTRAKINLAKVIDVIYIDHDSKTPDPSSYRNFSEVLFLENAFKLKFSNGEVIDFGAPTKQEKKEWISLIQRIIQRNKFRVQPWVKIMLESNNILNERY